jgi:multicomponent Na+:H+ antiporter subunit E
VSRNPRRGRLELPSLLHPWFLPFYLGVWWLLTGGAPGAFALGLVVIAAALAIRRWLGAGARRPWSPTGALLFLPYFLWQALRGGFDVALRALSPRLPIAPGLLRYRTFLPEGPPRVLFANSISLLPGTFTAQLQGSELEVHLLDQEAPAERQLQTLERRVARIFSVDPFSAETTVEGR